MMERSRANRLAKRLDEHHGIGKESDRRSARLDPEVQSLLRTAEAVQDVPRPEPNPAWVAAARQRILVSARKNNGIALSPPDWRSSLTFGLSRVLASMVVVFVFLLVGGAFSFVTQSALPGDLLYPAKIALEDAHMWTASDAEDAVLQARYAGNRLTEIQLLVVQDRYEDVDIAVAAFENDVDEAVIALAHLALSDSNATYPVLLLVEADIRAYSESLTELKALVPSETQQVLDRAVAAGMSLSLSTD